MLNHAPVVIAMLLPILLGWTLAKGGSELRKLAAVSTVVLGLSAAPAYLTGERAEEVVEPLVAEALVEEHEDAAFFALLLSEIVGAAGVLVLLVYRRSETIPSVPLGALFILSVISAISLGWAANLGGQIRHPEIREPAGGRPRDSEDETRLPYSVPGRLSSERKVSSGGAYLPAPPQPVASAAGRA
jgi:hypothetical protein